MSAVPEFVEKKAEAITEMIAVCKKQLVEQVKNGEDEAAYNTEWLLNEYEEQLMELRSYYYPK
jgi:hypothetical protein